MIYDELMVTLASGFATLYHCNLEEQVYPIGVADPPPYTYHLERVASQFVDPELKVIAYLHDILEDTACTRGRLEENFGTSVSEAVEILTHDKDVPYTKYIERIATSENEAAIQVKCIDLAENLLHSLRPDAPKRFQQRRKRHMRALKRLTESTVFRPAGPETLVSKHETLQ
jgi:(p)ppGpp synthase/HD superfamily hydrolase